VDSGLRRDDEQRRWVPDRRYAASGMTKDWLRVTRGCLPSLGAARKNKSALCAPLRGERKERNIIPPMLRIDPLRLEGGEKNQLSAP